MRAKLLIEPTAWDAARHDACAHAGVTERGGLLLGYRRGPHLHIDFATMPSPADRPSRFAFHRNTAGHQSIASERWLTSGGTSDWLGEWHSHPEPNPRPSATDTTEWRRLVQEAQRPMAFIIFGHVSEWVCIVTPHKREIQRLILIEDTAEGKVFAESRAISPKKIALRSNRPTACSNGRFQDCRDGG